MPESFGEFKGVSVEICCSESCQQNESFPILNQIRDRFEGVPGVFVRGTGCLNRCDTPVNIQISQAGREPDVVLSDVGRRNWWGKIKGPTVREVITEILKITEKI